MRSRVWPELATLGMVSALLVGSCALFKPKKPAIVFDVPPAQRFKLSLRFALLVPFDKVTAAARAELKSEGGEEEAQAGEGEIVHFKLTDEALKKAKAAGPAAAAASPAIDLADPGGADTNRDEMELRLWQEPNVLVAQVRFKREGTDEQEKEAFRRRAAKVFRVIAHLPGVGPSVDRDGVPRDHQFNELSLDAVRSKSTDGDGGGAGVTAIDVNPLLLGLDAGTEAGRR